MYMYEPSISPSAYQEWEKYELPLLCRNRILEVCEDILKRGDRTKYQAIYDAIYEMAESDVLEEQSNI